MGTVTKQFHRVACWSRAPSWQIQHSFQQGWASLNPPGGLECPAGTFKTGTVSKPREAVSPHQRSRHTSLQKDIGNWIPSFPSFQNQVRSCHKKKHVDNKCPVLHEATTCVHAKEEKTQKETAQLPTRLGLIESTFFSVRKLLLTGWAM